ncbi:MAG: hypothetical protein BAJALOKI3v1_50014 [Promethearchaeota archaeon]|nr:MAG: hypothetical protein BAJALOKI3v1_50014 [Candidatus Lokiarchaeota archaeon]
MIKKCSIYSNSPPKKTFLESLKEGETNTRKVLIGDLFRNKGVVCGIDLKNKVIKIRSLNGKVIYEKFESKA